MEVIKNNRAKTFLYTKELYHWIQHVQIENNSQTKFSRHSMLSNDVKGKKSSKET